MHACLAASTAVTAPKTWTKPKERTQGTEEVTEAEAEVRKHSSPISVFSKDVAVFKGCFRHTASSISQGPQADFWGNIYQNCDVPQHLLEQWLLAVPGPGSSKFSLFLLD